MAGSHSDDATASEQGIAPHYAYSTRNEAAYSDWYVPSSLQTRSEFSLHDCVLSREDTNELFLYFAEFHLPHCGFLIRVNPLEELAEDSELLLWTIILIAARHHRKHHRSNRALETAHSRLRAEVCNEEIRKLPDLQAVLLLCMWPLPVKSQDGDTAGLRLAEALSCARQMGLDMRENENPFGIPRAARRLQKYPARTVRLTWLKCFELEVQLSLWHGTLPALAASRYFTSVAEICRSSDIPRTVAQTMDFNAQMARYLLLVDGTSGPDAAWNLAKSSLQSLRLAKEFKIETWSLENELVYETCYLYICMTSYVHILRQQRASPGDCEFELTATYAQEHLLDGKDRAITIIHRLSALTDEAMSKDRSSHAGTTPLPGFPKNAARLMFFATSVVLTYLSSESNHPSRAQEKAHNAFEEALRFFHRCPKAISHILAGNTLEVAGRAIMQRRARLQSHVTTRMGASIMHDVRWLRAVLSGRDIEGQYDTSKSGASTPANDRSGISVEAGDAPQMPDSGQTSQWTDWCYSGTEMLPSSLDLPAFEMWDDMLHGVWQDDFLGEL